MEGGKRIALDLGSGPNAGIPPMPMSARRASISQNLGLGRQSSIAGGRKAKSNAAAGESAVTLEQVWAGAAMVLENVYAELTKRLEQLQEQLSASILGTESATGEVRSWRRLLLLLPALLLLPSLELLPPLLLLLLLLTTAPSCPPADVELQQGAQQVPLRLHARAAGTCAALLLMLLLVAVGLGLVLGVLVLVLLVLLLLLLLLLLPPLLTSPRSQSFNREYSEVQAKIEKGKVSDMLVLLRLVLLLVPLLPPLLLLLLFPLPLLPLLLLPLLLPLPPAADGAAAGERGVAGPRLREAHAARGRAAGGPQADG